MLFKARKISNEKFTGENGWKRERERGLLCAYENEKLRDAKGLKRGRFKSINQEKFDGPRYERIFQSETCVLNR